MDLLNLPDQDVPLSFVHLCNITEKANSIFYYVYNGVSSNFLALSSENYTHKSVNMFIRTTYFIWGLWERGGGWGGPPPIFLVNIIENIQIWKPYPSHTHLYYAWIPKCTALHKRGQFFNGFFRCR